MSGRRLSLDPNSNKKVGRELERRQRAYVEGAPESTPTQSVSQDRCIQERKTKEDVRQVNVMVPVSVFARLKLQGALKDKRQGELINEAILAMVEKLEASTN